MLFPQHRIDKEPVLPAKSEAVSIDDNGPWRWAGVEAWVAMDLGGFPKEEDKRRGQKERGSRGKSC